jgi:hypothetical protein
MAGKSDYLENLVLDLIFKATTNATFASAAGTAANLYVALHSADPYASNETGTQSTSEIAYTGYARVTVARSAGGWTRTGNSISPAANIDFPQCTGSTATATHFSIGELASGTGALLYAGAISPTISISNGVIPRLTTASTVTED